VFLRAAYGLPMRVSEQEIFRRHTGRSEYKPPTGGWAEVACIVGRQSGKSRVAALIASFKAVRAKRERDGTETHALLVAQDQRAALRVLFQYARAAFETVQARKPTGLSPGMMKQILAAGRAPLRQSSLRPERGSFPRAPTSVQPGGF